jgi:transglutaminase-like putative cysteine protease
MLNNLRRLINGSQLPKGAFMKRIIISVIAFLSVVLLSSIALHASATAEFNRENLDRGLISIKYSSPNTTKKAKVLIQFKEQKYQYNIKSGGAYENFPLQLGNGAYQVGVYEQIEDTKYSQVAITTVNLSLDDNSKVFLTSNQLINWGDKMNTVTLAKELTKSKKTEAEKIEVCYQYMVQQFSYDFVKMKNLEYDYIPVIDDVLKKKLGICYDYSAVFASMLRSQGIKCKLIMGYTTNVKEYHAWNDVYVNDKWVVVDSTYDSQMYTNRVKYKFEKSRKDYKESYEY